MLERNDVDFPLWRKKVDSSLLTRGETPIPKWLHEVWNVQEIFSGVTTKRHKRSHTTVEFKGRFYRANVTHKLKDNKFWLRIEASCVRELQLTFLASYMRKIEADLVRVKDKSSSHREVEVSIPFWEFLDIEFNKDKKSFIFTAHYTQSPQFPNLFYELVSSAPFSRVENDIRGKNDRKFPFQIWKSCSEYKKEIGAFNVIYFLQDSSNGLLYIGEAKDLIKRFNQGHKEINEWDMYSFFCLPDELSRYRLAIERSYIQLFSTLLTNKSVESSINMAEFKLSNLKIDQ
ncbi:MAG: GIY-YIG nuclease family protein [Cellvibrionaceae bacterium]|nr:GIY-YIG nuclease family protein [Cellvibrionaceae bacterium]